MQKVSLLVLVLGMSALISTCAGHGYVHDSRSHKCKLGANLNCGAVQYEPQSVEAHKNFPENNIPDGRLASGNLPQFHELDEVAAGRWRTVPITRYATGPRNGTMLLTFPWTITASHKTHSFKYYITKRGFDHSKDTLSRDNLELAPFCVRMGNECKPDADHITKSCELDTTGYNGTHIILAVWNIADTVNAFYQAIDVDF